MTIYPEAFANTRPITDMSLRGGDGITHLHYNGSALWPFGFGGSYSSFAVTAPSMGASPIQISLDLDEDYETLAAERYIEVVITNVRHTTRSACV